MAGRPPFDQCNVESEYIESYLERLQEYFTAYDIGDDEDPPGLEELVLIV